MLSKKQFLAYWDGGMVGGDREKWGWAVMFMQRGTCWPQPKLGKAKLYVHLVISPFGKKISLSHIDQFSWRRFVAVISSYQTK